MNGEDFDYRQATDYELLVEIVPDIERRLEQTRTEKPQLFEEIRHRAVDKDEEGWRPLHWWRGCL